jgi:hypothetical protein
MNLGGQALPESWASCRAGYLSKTIMVVQELEQTILFQA